MPAPQKLTVGDDKLNWEALWNATKNQSDISRTGDENIFDRIVRINAEARGTVKFTLFNYCIHVVLICFHRL